jgi:glutaredoxin
VRPLFATLGLCAALGFSLAHAQVYRWTDQQGRVRYSDTPPPATAKDVQKKPFSEDPMVTRLRATQELAVAKQRFPVKLYTSPSCRELCGGARLALNARSVPFEEVQVWDPESNEALQKASGGNEVPVVLVGETVVRGFDAAALDNALDAAGYPKQGLLPSESQAAPELPEGYVAGGKAAAPATPAEASEPAPEAEKTPPPR